YRWNAWVGELVRGIPESPTLAESLGQPLARCLSSPAALQTAPRQSLTIVDKSQRAKVPWHQPVGRRHFFFGILSSCSSHLIPRSRRLGLEITPGAGDSRRLAFPAVI